MRRPLSITPGTVAALFVDLQEEHRRDRRYLVESFDAVITNARRLQQTGRASGASLYHCAFVVDLESKPAGRFHPVLPDGRSAFSDRADPYTAVCPEVAPAHGEPLLIKHRASAFTVPFLAKALQTSGIEWLVIAGVWTDACVDASVKDALALGFRVLLVKDACGSGTAAMHQTAILNLANRLYGGAVVDTDGACRLLEGETIDAWQVDGAVPIRFTFETAAELYRSL